MSPVDNDPISVAWAHDDTDALADGWRAERAARERAEQQLAAITDVARKLPPVDWAVTTRGDCYGYEPAVQYERDWVIFDRDADDEAIADDLDRDVAESIVGVLRAARALLDASTTEEPTCQPSGPGNGGPDATAEPPSAPGGDEKDDAASSAEATAPDREGSAGVPSPTGPSQPPASDTPCPTCDGNREVLERGWRVPCPDCTDTPGADRG